MLFLFGCTHIHMYFVAVTRERLSVIVKEVLCAIIGFDTEASGVGPFESLLLI